MREVRWGSAHENVRRRMSQVREGLPRNGKGNDAQVALLVPLIVIPTSEETRLGRSLFGLRTNCEHFDSTRCTPRHAVLQSIDTLSPLTDKQH